jgi:hypothetical protein
MRTAQRLQDGGAAAPPSLGLLGSLHPVGYQNPTRHPDGAGPCGLPYTPRRAPTGRCALPPPLRTSSPGPVFTNASESGVGPTVHARAAVLWRLRWTRTLAGRLLGPFSPRRIAGDRALMVAMDGYAVCSADKVIQIQVEHCQAGQVGPGIGAQVPYGPALPCQVGVMRVPGPWSGQGPQDKRRHNGQGR